MRKYAFAVNSVVFLVSCILGLYVVTTILQSPPATPKTDPARRVVTLGTIFKLEQDALILKYTFSGKELYVKIILGKETTFHFSKPLVRDDGVIYGREIREASYADLTEATQVVVDWIYYEEIGYIANDVTIVDEQEATLLY